MRLGQLNVDENGLKNLCVKWRISKLEAFGSVLREDFTPDSDIDLLVSFAPDAKWSYFDLYDAEEEFRLLLGREVDLVSRRGIESSQNWIRRQAILESAVPVYGS